MPNQQKVALRQHALMMWDKEHAWTRGEPPFPVVLEAYAGKGDLYAHTYAIAPFRSQIYGVALDNNTKHIDALSKQRRHWSVYQCDAPVAIAEGVGAHYILNFLDIDPPQRPWDAIQAFFESLMNRKRPVPKYLFVVADSHVKTDIHIAQETLESCAAPLGYEVMHFQGATYGRNMQFFAILET